MGPGLCIGGRDKDKNTAMYKPQEIIAVVTHTSGLGKWLGFASAQVSCYPWGCGYTAKDSHQGVKYSWVNDQA